MGVKERPLAYRGQTVNKVNFSLRKKQGIRNAVRNV